MLKQELTPERAERIQLSLQVLAILSQCMLFESLQTLDTDFRIPNLNNFAKRIIGDARAIQTGLEKSGRWKVVPSDHLEEYSAEIYRVVGILCGIDLQLVKEFADYLEKTFENIEE